MLLTGYVKRIFRPVCNPSFESVHCIAKLNEDISEVLPYLNAVLGGTEYFSDPPEVMFSHYGKIIKVGSREIAINALEDEDEAERILSWLKDQINEAWENRGTITPKYTGGRKPQIMAILKLLPRSNCKRCGRPTCTVFAAQMAEGGLGPEHCPELTEENRRTLTKYLAGFDSS
ncbi:MAG: (Fe-S)-binding protein [Syntrophorhabdaceae bacterium]|nr:(Fe-S)-binding protein [Syntrophorhabdaceae bacterium]MDD5242584.1 (Fe-S)-binding protein [Syntrophorhabdaceae bacterium]